MTQDRLDPISETALPDEPDEHRPPEGETGTGAYPDAGRADPRVADPAFELDDSDPNPATGAPSGPNDPVRWPEDDAFSRDADEDGESSTG